MPFWGTSPQAFGLPDQLGIDLRPAFPPFALSSSCAPAFPGQPVTSRRAEPSRILRKSLQSAARRFLRFVDVRIEQILAPPQLEGTFVVRIRPRGRR